MKSTPKAGPTPNASFDFNKVHDNAKAGRKNIYEGAIAAPPKAAEAPAPAVAAAAPPSAAGTGKGE